MMIEHPYECVKDTDAGWKFLDRPNEQVFRRQDYQNNFYYINGAIYLNKTLFLEKSKGFFFEGISSLYVMAPEYGVDIDEVNDLMRAEFYLNHVIKQK